MSDFEVLVCLKEGGPGREFTMSTDVLRASSPYLRDLLYEALGSSHLRLQLDGISQLAFDGLKAYLRNRTRQFLELDWQTLCSLTCSDVLGTSCETKVLLATLSWLEHDYQNRRQFEDSVLACIRYGLLPEPVLIMCFEPPPKGRMALSGRPVRMKLMEAAFSHYVRIKGRPDLALETRKRTFTGTEPADLLLEESIVSPMSAPLSPAGVARPPQTAPSGAFLAPGVQKTDTARFRGQEDKVTKAQAVVRGFLARRDYFKLHARPKPPALLQEGEEQPVSLAAMEEAWCVQRSLQALPKLPDRGPHRSSALLLVCGGLGPDKLLDFSCAILGYGVGQLWRCGKLPQPRHQHAVTCLGGALYVLGGLDTRNSRRGLRLATSSCFRYQFLPDEDQEASAGRWERLPDMRHARINHAALALRGRVYAIAGQDEFDVFLSSVEWYEPGASSWTELPWPLPCRLSACGVAAFRDSLHLAGGLVQAPRHPDCLYVVSSLLRWDAGASRWQKAGSSLPSGRGSLALVEHKGSLYAIGGLARTDAGHLRVLSDVIAYNERDAAWRKCPSLPEPLHACQAFSLGGQLLVVSGSRILCLEGEEWTCKAVFPATLTGSAAAAVPSPPVALPS
ncbi:uncharacterized protein LOC144108657 [Amblyomma americanum]